MVVIADRQTYRKRSESRKRERMRYIKIGRNREIEEDGCTDQTESKGR